MKQEQWDRALSDADDIEVAYSQNVTMKGRELGYVWLVWDFVGWAFFAKNGVTLRGWTMRYKHGEWMLIAKVTIDDIPSVGFMSASTTTGCVSKALDRLKEGTWTFYPDKFA